MCENIYGNFINMRFSRLRTAPFTNLNSKATAIVSGALLIVTVRHANAVTISAASPALSDVSAAVASASDGDTVTVPAGKASWNSALTLTKGITLTGATTVSNAGSSNPTANDLTIIQDNSPLNTSASGIIKASLLPTQSFRLTGFTFTYGTRTTTNNNAIVTLTSSNATSTSPVTNARVDNCHFVQPYSPAIQVAGWVYGVADHNWIVNRNNNASFQIDNGAFYGGYAHGNGAWADYPWFGTFKFFFVEDNTMVGNGLVSTSGRIDSTVAGRFVVRHNDFTNARAGWHGTEGNDRGCRAVEVYNNSSHWPAMAPADLNRSGTSLQHDNSWDGISNPDNSITTFMVYREIGGVSASIIYGVSDGTSVCDANDTEGNGTYVVGHPSHLFDSGTATSGTAPTTTSGPVATMTDSSKNWTNNQWVGYSIKQTNPAAPSYLKGSYIISNDAHTITFYTYTSGDRGPELLFAAGDTYAIHRVLIPLDQIGRGKGDLLFAGTSGIIDTVTNSQQWPTQALEPAFSWNNVYTPTNTSWGFESQMPTEVQGRDYYNLGANLAANSTPSQVSNIYTAALNGTDYTGTYTYPHPLVSGAPTAPTNLRVVP